MPFFKLIIPVFQSLLIISLLLGLLSCNNPPSSSCAWKLSSPQQGKTLRQNLEDALLYKDMHCVEEFLSANKWSTKIRSSEKTILMNKEKFINGKFKIRLCSIFALSCSQMITLHVVDGHIEFISSSRPFDPSVIDSGGIALTLLAKTYGLEAELKPLIPDRQPGSQLILNDRALSMKDIIDAASSIGFKTGTMTHDALWHRLCDNSRDTPLMAQLKDNTWILLKDLPSYSGVFYDQERLGIYIDSPLFPIFTRIHPEQESPTMITREQFLDIWSGQIIGGKRKTPETDLCKRVLKSLIL